jgi:hypothetical protein
MMPVVFHPDAGSNDADELALLASVGPPTASDPCDRDAHRHPRGR